MVRVFLLLFTYHTFFYQIWQVIFKGKEGFYDFSFNFHLLSAEKSLFCL